ncbi:anthranilate phosphoribosyltransferase [Methanoculleus sp. Wushi-C6]|uniref:Anthranilate phosphoribosyltransferase n=1 Tax=Methanoculleus caldifontis TaxID=2651577 RepID=A0ABU3WYY2_9EURY|nr:anthranilate phosphoribosyltransferase [Methanoculleus sp. Wushi-C6]MDV2481012.1 anthranilate phosphoribosyltransferase [Methanoculleus sp. Wushi-C6]
MIREAIARVSSGTDLTPAEAGGVMEEIMRGAATPAQIGGFLTALRMKGETVAEIAALARVMRAAAVPVSLPAPDARVDTCGTGGDGAGTFNISTAAAFVAAGAGVPIVKHGNRGVSSRCGSADVLEALGVSVAIPPDRVAEVLSTAGIVFLFAPAYHPAMQHARPARQEIGIRTVFNLLGPLANPAGAGAHLLGVYDPRLTAPVARVLADLGAKRAMVVHGAGLDEIATAGPTTVAELRGGEVVTYTLDCTEYGIPHSPLAAIRGGGPAENAATLLSVLSGDEGPARDIVLLNAGAAIYLGGKAGGIAGGIARAEASIDSGAALERLRRLVEATGGAA